MAQYIQVNGKMEWEKEEENKFGKMDLFMRVIGEIMVQMEKAD